ncbi:Pyruvate synthase subunit porA [Leclercia adecarboxylata]|uniref:Pyruvate synthase subunit porA n=1 Tax=Leclercia adecarboxylata TaxID=83655 RepID=A0A4U9HW95_9ENTR|nr:Pyruvate synthase subunit porA [Leclercia adecarboxylata]
MVDELLSRGEKVGVLKVRLYRPFSAKHLLAVLPESARTVAVLDRTKEPGAHAEPLYLDVMTALAEAFNNGERGDAAAGHWRALWPVVKRVWPGVRAGHLQRTERREAEAALHRWHL